MFAPFSFRTLAVLLNPPIDAEGLKKRRSRGGGELKRLPNRHYPPASMSSTTPRLGSVDVEEYDSAAPIPRPLINPLFIIRTG